MPHWSGKRRRVIVICAMILGPGSTAACAAAQPVDVATRPALGAGDVMEFDARGKHVELRSVKYVADSVSGVPWKYPADPRVTFATAELSHVKVTREHDPGDGVGMLAKVIFGGIVLLGLLSLWFKAHYGDT